MQLKVSQNLDNNRVRLDFKKSPSTPDRAPSYEIDKSKADEFVKRYNTQGVKLATTTQVVTNIGGLLGCLVGFHKRSVKLMIGGTLAGWALGFLAATGYTVRKKNSLMKKYNVKEIG
ncbi:MAG: hypothetical protein NC191_06160 [Muribaculaceae bacterium]|nr:hypothetical protein [Muribaculaceae bacterium]